MTEEKAIDRCNELIKSKNANWIGLSNQNAIETVLNMIKEKDKQIDLMTEHIQNGCDFDNRIKTKKDIKQYFKSKAEKE